MYKKIALLSWTLLLVVTFALVKPVFAAPVEDDPNFPAVKWISFPESRFQVCGLPWFKENAPDLWRLPARAKDKVRPPVWKLALYPTGGRIRFATNSTQLWIQVQPAKDVDSRSMAGLGKNGMDVYVNNVYLRSVTVGEKDQQKANFFRGADHRMKEITIYLPLFREVRVLAIGLDDEAELSSPAPFAVDKPIFFYGSSVMQGSGTSRPAMNYPAILSRMLNMDYIDLGFGGNGKAEPEVVDLIAEIDCCCYVLGLGKSYGMQPPEVYCNMLSKLRSVRPLTPIVCIAPIFSTREFYDDSYVKRSQYDREVVRQAVNQRIQAGDKHIYLVEGMTLLGPLDADAFYEGTHPSAFGYHRMAERLYPVVSAALHDSQEKTKP